MARPKLDDPSTITFDPGTIPPTGWEKVWHNKGMKAGFEEGVDAGRKWGHEEKDEEWRGKIQEMLQNTPTDYHHRVEAIPVHLVEELLSGRDIE